ncbi:hypothetical protein ABPG73_003909 [Tetrahymena malaccensis]
MDLKQILSFIILTFFVNAKQCYEILNCDICEDIFNCSTCRDGFQWSIKDQACILNCQQNQVTTQNDCENECQIPSFYTDQNSQNLTCQQTLQCPLMHYFGDEYSMYDKPQSFILLENEQYLIVIDLQNFYVLNINNGKKITEKSLQNAIFASAYNSENQEIILIDINNNIFIYNLKMHFLDKFQISKEQSLLRIKKNSFIIPELHSVLLFGQLNDAYLYNYKMKSIIITLPITNIYEQLDIVSYLSLGLNYLDSQIFYFYWIQANIFHVLEVTQIKSEQFSENMIYQQKFQNLQIVNNRFIKSQYINLMKHVIVLFDQAAIYFDIQKKIIQNISLNSCINTTQNITNFQAQNKTFILVNTKNEMCIFGYSSGAQKWELLFKTIGQDILSYFELDSLAKSILILDKTQVINVFQIQPNNTYQLTNQQKIKQYQTTLAIQSKQNSSLFYFLGSDCTILQISNPEWIPHNSSNRQFEFEIQSKLITYSQGKKYNLSDVQTVLINHQQERILIHYSQNNFYQNTQFHLYDGISKKYLRSFQQGVDYEETSNLYQIFEYPKFIVVIFKSGFHILIDIESLMIVDQFVFDQGFTKQNFYNSVYLRNPPQNFEYLFSYSNVILYVYKYDYSKPLNFFKLDFTYQLDNQQGLNHFMFGFIYAIGKYIYITSQIGVNILLFDYTQNFKQLNSYQDQTLNGQMIFIDVLINNNRIIMTYIDGTIALFDINLSLIIKIQMKDEFMTVAWNVKLTIKMYYDEQNMYLITVNEAGDIIIWEMSKLSQLTSYKQYLTNKSLNQNINIILDNQNNYFISHNDKTLILWEYSHYIAKGGEYETLPIKYEIPHVYDYNRNILLISDENKNVFMYSNNQYQYIKEFQTDLRGIFKLTGLPSQLSDEYYYFAYDFQHSYILSNNLNIINTKQNTFTSLCKFTFDLKDEQNIKKIFFEDNQASIYGQNFTSVPFYLQYNILESDNDDYQVVEVDSNQHINQFGSGHSLSIQIKILDENNEEILFQNIIQSSQDIKREFDNYIIQLVAKQNSIFLENNFIVIKADQESLIFKNVVVTGIPLTDQIFYIQAPFLHSLDESNGILNVLKEYPIKINFRNCKQGEYYQESSGQRVKCNVCQNNTYSLVDIPPDIIINHTIQCKPCPDSADYCYGNIIQVSKGYWRIDNNSDVIVYCEDNPDNCVGYTDYKNGTYCKEGYIGPLCEQCDTQGDLWEKRYTFISNYECGECDVFNAYIRQILILLGITIYIFISLNLAHKIYKKIAIVYYLRMMNMISFGNSILSSNSQVYAKQLIHYLQVAYTINDVQLHLPFQITTASDFLGNPVDTFVIALGCMFPTQMQIPQVYMWAILGTSYVVADYTLECFTPEYFTYAVTIFVPSFNQLNFITNQRKYGFLYNDYKYKYYYWEFFRSFIKILIQFFFFFFESTIKQITVSFTLIYYYVMLQKFEPFKNKYMNQLDNRTQITLMIIYMINLFSLKIQNETLNMVISIICYGIYYGFGVYLAILLLKTKIQDWVKHFYILKQQLLVKYPKLSKCLKNSHIEKYNTIKINLNILKLKKKVFKNLNLIRQKQQKIYQLSCSELCIDQINVSEESQFNHQSNLNQSEQNFQNQVQQKQEYFIEEKQQKSILQKSQLNKQRQMLKMKSIDLLDIDRNGLILFENESSNNKQCMRSISSSCDVFQQFKQENIMQQSTVPVLSKLFDQRQQKISNLKEIELVEQDSKLLTLSYLENNTYTHFKKNSSEQPLDNNIKSLVFDQIEMIQSEDQGNQQIPAELKIQKDQNTQKIKSTKLIKSIQQINQVNSKIKQSNITSHRPYIETDKNFEEINLKSLSLESILKGKNQN